LIPAGWLVDRIGARWILLVGEVIGGIFTAAMFNAQTYATGLVFMGLAGFGLGFIMPTTTKAIMVWFPIKERATAMGFKQTGLNVGGIITASVLPAVALALSWHYGFLGTGLVSVVIGVVSFILYKEPPPDASLNVTPPEAAPAVKRSLKEVFKSRDIWFISLAGMCINAVEFSVAAYFVLYLQEFLLFTVVIAGLFLALLQSGGAFGKPVSGFISDRLFSGRRKTIYFLLCGIAGVVCLVWSFLGQGSSSWLVGILAVIAGFSAIGWAGVHLTMVGEIAGKELAGEAVGTSTVFLMVGSIVGPPVFGYIIDTTGSYAMAWQFLAVLGIISVVFLFFVREKRGRM